MAAILLSLVVVCVACLFVGQAILRLAGAEEWSWLAPPVGLAALMLIGSPGVDVPGRATTMAILMGLITVAAIVWCVSSPAHRPPLGGLVAVAPVAFLVLLPFIASGRSGILGVNLDNDMAAHMTFAEMYLSEAVENLHPRFYGLYPLGPHSIAGILARGLHQRVDHTFAGFTMAVPLLTGWTTLALVRRSAWWKKLVIASVVSMPFLVAAYYGQGSFKELIQTSLVLATVVFFAGEGPRLGRGRWVPFAVLAAGTVAVYSETGLAWPAAFGLIWLGLVTMRRLYRRRNFDGIVGLVRAELPALGIGLAVFILSLLPQAGRIHNFFAANSGANGIIVPKSILANLVAPLPGWEGFGYWDTADYRLPLTHPFSAGIAIAFMFALVLFGAWQLCRRGRWMLPLAAAGAMAIWRISMHSQSPYVVAKALVIASPLLLLVALLPLLESIPDRLFRPRGGRNRATAVLRTGLAAVRGRPLPWALAALLIAGVVVLVATSDVRALRASLVGPDNHADELRELRPFVGDHRTLFLGNDDFIKWELSAVPVAAPIFGVKERLLNEAKHWENGEPLDFDTVTAATLNSFYYVITTKDQAGSEPPPQMHLVASTLNYQLWKRVGEVQERSILPEGEGSGAVLDCTRPPGSKIVQAGGVAAVRPAPVVVTGAALTPGAEVTLQLPLVRGEWTLEASYVTGMPIAVTGHGVDVTLQANLDRLGPRWPLAKIVVRHKEDFDLTFKVDDTALAPHLPIANIDKITATPSYPEKVVPIRQACGRYVDWYRSAGSDR